MQIDGCANILRAKFGRIGPLVGAYAGKMDVLGLSDGRKDRRVFLGNHVGG